MSPLTILDDISIASPCEADWAEMEGDHRTRFCTSCSKHVHNIVGMTAEEATSLILESEGRLCARIYRRSDGTILTADCPVGSRKVSAGRRLRRALALGIVLPTLLVAGVAARGFGARRLEPFPSGPGVTWDDRLDWALVNLGLRTRPQVFLGKLCLPVPAFPPPVTNGSVPVPPVLTDDQIRAMTPLPTPEPPNLGGTLVKPIGPE